MNDLALTEILQIIQIAAVIVGGGMVAFRLGRTSSRMEGVMRLQSAEISDLKSEVKILSKMLTDLAVQKQRLDSHEKRIDQLTGWVDEIRHGEGFVLPITPRP